MDVCQTSIISDAVVKGRSTRAIAAMREELDSPCTEEIAAFDRFIDLASRDTYDATVFDMAPTGHALRQGVPSRAGRQGERDAGADYATLAAPAGC